MGRLLIAGAALVLLGLFVFLVYKAVQGIVLHNRVKGLDDPLLLLPQKERQQYVREMLAQQRQEQDIARQKDLMDIINNPEGKHL